MALYLGQATSIVCRTLPFLFLRALVYTLFALLFLLYMGLLFLIGRSLSHLHPLAEVFTWFVGLALTFPLMRLAREYLLYIVKAGHIAVIAELAVKGKLPDGVSQIAWGREQVQKNFKQTSVLFLFDRLVAGVVAAINSMMWRVSNALGGLPIVGGLVKLANTVLRFSSTYIDEAVLARNFLKPNETIWQSAKTGVVLYAQAWRQILTTALILGLFSLIVFPVLFFISISLAAGLGLVYAKAGVLLLAVAASLTFLMKAVFFDPWALTLTILNYLKTTEGMTPNAEWEAKLENVSSKFKQLKQKTLEAK